MLDTRLRYPAGMHDDDTDPAHPATITPPLYQGKANDGQPLPPRAGLVYLADRGTWMVDLNAEKRRAEEHEAELRRCLAPDWPAELPHEVSGDGPWVATLFDGELNTSFSQIYVESQLGPGEPCAEYGILEHFAGQSNGLCGGALTGRLCLMTAKHTGRVPLVAELHSAEPPLDEQWEDAVELSFQVDPWRVAIVPLLTNECFPLPLPRGHYRLRCCARGLIAEWDTRPREVEERYLLQFWRSTGRRPDQVLRVGSAHARHQHGEYGGKG